MAEYTVNDIISKRPCGSITPLVIGIKDDLFPIVVIKEYREDLVNIKSDHYVGVKSTSVGNEKVNLYLLILKFGEGFNNFYDIWFNYGYDNHREFLNLLKEHDRIIIDFRDENNEKFITLQLENTIKDHIDSYISQCNDIKIVKGEIVDNVIQLDKLEKYTTWNDDDVYDLMDKIADDYPTCEELWTDL